MYLIKNLKMAVRETTGVPVHNDTEVNNMSFVLKGCQRRNSCLVQLASSWNCEETLSEVHVHRCAYLYCTLQIFKRYNFADATNSDLFLRITGFCFVDTIIR